MEDRFSAHPLFKEDNDLSDFQARLLKFHIAVIHSPLEMPVTALTLGPELSGCGG